MQLSDGEHALMLSRGTNNVEAWQYCVQALDYWLRLNASDHVAARAFANKAIELDPNYAAAWAILGRTYLAEGRLGLGGDNDTKFEAAAHMTAKAMALDDGNPYAIGISSHVAAAGRHDRGVEIARSGLDRLPGNADVRCYMAYALMHAGRYEEAIDNFRGALALNPRAPNWYLGGFSRALLCLGHFDEALRAIERILVDEPDFFQAWLCRAFIFQKSARDQQAKNSMAQAMRLAPNFKCRHIPSFFLHKDPAFLQDITETFRDVGLPE